MRNHADECLHRGDRQVESFGREEPGDYNFAKWFMDSNNQRWHLKDSKCLGRIAVITKEYPTNFVRYGWAYGLMHVDLTNN